jgi:DNA helicase-2/ATP-dependent DNA helicase PcrA
VNTLLESMEDLRRNERQWEAFNVASHCVVLAPPGSGKTKLLTTRMAYDLHTAVTAPHGVACVTLTNAAASELRQRLDHLGVARRPEVFVGTVHSFVVSRIIKPFAAAAGEPHLSSQGLATTQQCTANANRAVHEVFGHNLHSRDLSRYREQLTVARQQLTTGEAWNAFPPGLQRAAEIYRTLMADRGLTDFLGLVADAVRLVEDHPALRSVLNASLPRLYVDEYQDLAPGLDRLVRHLCLDEQAEAVLFAVGDPDQAVFAFTGTRPELLLELREHPRVTPVELDQNYRSGQTLIDTAGRMRPGRPPVRGTRDGGRIQAVLCPGELDDQIDAAVRHVADLNDAGVVLHEIAVVCPQNAHCVQVAGALRASGLPARTRETSYRTTRATRLVEECAAWAVGGQETSGTRLHDVLASWRELLGPGWRRSHDVRLTGHLLRHRDLRDRSLVEFIDGIRSCAPDDPCTPTSPTDDSNELARLRDAAQGGELADLTVSEFAERVRRRDRVHISTMTLSKGLEFDVVIVIGLDEEIVPFWASRNDPAQLAEDRRKFYVSITRARESLLLLYSGAVRKPWGDINRTGPSRFLAEIGAIESPNRN